jgi:glycerophosphoryl diester phosphodiesterase
MSDLAFLTRNPIAHRGLHNVAQGVIENTRSAFLAAVAGDFAIECDIQLTADGDAVVFHDFTLDRLTEAQGRVSALTVAQLKAVRFKQTADPMLTLAELLALVAGKVPLIVEIKSAFNGELALTRRAIEVVKAYQGPLALMSFDPDCLICLKQEAPQLVRGFVGETHHDDPHYRDHVAPDMIRRLEDFSFYPDAEPHFLSWRIADMPHPATVLYRSGLRLPVICWTVRTDEDRARAALHADQITFEGFVP